jgi:PAS domain S-box-containing protein
MPGRTRKNPRDKPRNAAREKLPASPKRKKKKLTRPATLVNTQTLESLKESQRQLKIVLDAAHTGIWEWNIKTGKLSWSDTVLEIYRISRAAFGNCYEDFISKVHPEDRPGIIQHVTQALEHGTNYHIEHRILFEDGTVGWVEAFGNVLRDKKGNPVKMTGTAQDITHKKRIEKEREEWKIRHEMISTSAGLVIYDYAILSGEIVWSGNSLEVLGYPPEELGNLDQWVDRIHPDDQQEAFYLLDIAQKTLAPYDVYYRFLTKSGMYCYMHDRGFFLGDNAGQATRMLGMMNDVTERVKAEELLRESEQRFRTLQQASFGGIGLHDKGIIVDCNQGLCDITGYTYAELMGSNGLALVAPEWRDFVMEKIL